MIAGPTEVLIIADQTARPERVAADMIAQAEHDEDATSWCVTTDPDLAAALPTRWNTRWIEPLEVRSPGRPWSGTG